MVYPEAANDDFGGKIAGVDKVEGYLEVGHNEKGEIVINHPDLKPDENGVGHIVFSVNQARNLARGCCSNARTSWNLWGKGAGSLPPQAMTAIEMRTDLLYN